MNADLPAGIESYLKEAGFTSTEMLVLRKLVEEDSLTVRELGSKTGKSTGVLDQAMKKLLSKKIAQRNIINGQPRYGIQSLDSIVKWVQHDMEEKKKILERRHQNFESFIASLKVDKKRPDIEYFHGLEGIKQAYLKLLEQNQEFLTLTTVPYLAEEDPLRIFRVDLFRKRQVRKIFQRVLAPDTPLSARFRSRDPFEFRRTLLLPESELQLTFEKSIVGDYVACINLKEESACLLKYPDLAKTERDAFNVLWSHAQALERGENPATAMPLPPVEIPLKTRFLSSFREFLLSKRSLAAFGIFALLSGALTFGLYKNNRELNLQRVQDKVMAIAATGALQFDAKDIDAVRGPDDIHRPEYAKLIATLNLIRRSNSGIEYTYLMRKTDDPSTYAFVADADSLDPSLKEDINADGKIDSADALNYPGEPYDISTFPIMAHAFDGPVSDFGVDQWGSLISGFAPIYDEHRTAVAIIGIDMFTSKLDELSAQTFSPLLVFVALFLVFCIFRFFALNRSLTKEFVDYLGHHKVRTFLWATFIALSLLCLRYAFLTYTDHLVIRERGERLRSIALSVVNEFDPEDLKQLHFARDMKTEAYQRVFKKLNDVRNRFPEVTFAYFVRPTKDPDLFEFVADADSNYNLPMYTKNDISDHTLLSESDENIWPGVIYDDSLGRVFSMSLRRSSFGEPIFDQWGAALTGCAPIIQNESAIAILCLDINLSYQ